MTGVPIVKKLSVHPLSAMADVDVGAGGPTTEAEVSETQVGYFCATILLLETTSGGGFPPFQGLAGGVPRARG